MKKINKKVKFLVYVVLFLFIFFIGIVFYLYNGFEIYKTTYNFLYSKPWSVLPEDKLMSSSDFYSKFIIYSKDTNTFSCVSTGKAQIEVKLFEKKLNNNCTNYIGRDCSISRFASVCGNEYVITNPSLSGSNTYGIFKLK